MCKILQCTRSHDGDKNYEDSRQSNVSTSKILHMHLYKIITLKSVGGTSDIFGSEMKTLKMVNPICLGTSILFGI